MQGRPGCGRRQKMQLWSPIGHAALHKCLRRFSGAGSCTIRVIGLTINDYLPRSMKRFHTERFHAARSLHRLPRATTTCLHRASTKGVVNKRIVNKSNFMQPNQDIQAFPGWKRICSFAEITWIPWNWTNFLRIFKVAQMFLDDL